MISLYAIIYKTVTDKNFLRSLCLQFEKKMLKYSVFSVIKKEFVMSVNHFDTFENDKEIYAAVEKNKSKIIGYVSQPDLWNTPIKKSNSKKELELV